MPDLNPDRPVVVLREDEHTEIDEKINNLVEQGYSLEFFLTSDFHHYVAVLTEQPTP